MKAVFLDRDGVLVHMRTNKRGKERNSFVEPEAVRVINHIANVSGCKFVLSASMRILYDLDVIRNWWYQAGLRIDLIGAIPTHVPDKPHRRGHHIQAWLDANPETETFAIIDDEISDMEHLKYAVVKTEMFGGGLQDRHIHPVLKLLETNHVRSL